MMEMISCLLAGCFLAAVTPGWENVDMNRTEYPPVRVVWTAPSDGFAVAHEEGAEGWVSWTNGAIRIVKTNARGRLVVTAPCFLSAGRSLRLFADVKSESRTPMASKGHLAVYGRDRKISYSDPIGSRWFACGGEYMKRLINSAPGMTYRKYVHVEPDGEWLTPVIVVEGLPSDSTWTNRTAEDLAAAQENWDRHWEILSSPDRRADRIDEASFEKRIATDVDHTAEIRTVGGVSRLFVDGVETPPFVYKAPGREWGIKGRITYSGKPLQRAGVRLGVLNLRLGKLPSMSGPWSEKGFDVQWAVRAVRDEMRVGDESCFILAIGTSAYPKFSEEHPDEVWRRADGSVVRGNSGSAVPDLYNDGGKPDPGDLRWPWMSYTSPAWRAAIDRNVEVLVEELRRQGLLKRIVGVHFYGYHDGQFAVPVEDHSPCAKAEYARYLAERGLTGQEPEAAYPFFMKQIGFRALEHFSRAAKRAFGKPILAVRWCMLPFDGNEAAAYDVGSFLRSDAVDVIVPQPTYTQRLPALSQGMRLPCASLHLHRKMMWYEFDLRTYAALEGWAQSVVSTKGLGQADDFAMWQTVFRKHAGIMTAQRMGWWMYDMAGGWYYPDEIAKDCGEVYRFRAAFDAHTPDPWHPDLALVVDETALASYNRPDGPIVPMAPQIVMLQWPRTALAGVPYDFYMVEDWHARPELAHRYKAVVLCAFNAPDARQQAFRRSLEAVGIKTFVVPPAGHSPETLHKFARECGCYVAIEPGVVQVDMNGDFVSLHAVVGGTYDFNLPFAAEVTNVKSGKSEPVEGCLMRVTLSAGETCWFQMKRTSN